jgi:hypothetical protein
MNRTINASNCKYAPSCYTYTPQGATISGGGLYDRAVNFMFNSNLKDGEKHGILKTKDGWKAASYLGPGTQIAANIRNNLQPISEVDTVSQAHDLRYAFANNTEDVRLADLKMIKKVKQIKAAKADSRWNTAQASLIRGKVWLEDKGLVKPTSFASFGFDDGTSEEDKVLMKAKLDELTTRGYGKPKAKSKSSNWQTHVNTYIAKHKCSYKEALQKSKATYKRAD